MLCVIKTIFRLLQLPLSLCWEWLGSRYLRSSNLAPLGKIRLGQCNSDVLLPMSLVMNEVAACQSMILLIPEIQSTVLERGCRRPVTMEDSRKLYPSSVRRSVSSCQGERGVVFWILRVDLCPPQNGQTMVNFKLPSSALRVATFTSDTCSCPWQTPNSIGEYNKIRK